MVYPICYLVGPRGSGKTTMGAVLAEALTVALQPKDATAEQAAAARWCCLDTDDLLLRTFGESIASFVAREGWPAFRHREQLALRAASAPNTVLATGGGCILDAANRAFMREQGCVMYLHAPLPVLVARLQAQPLADQRPPLKGGDAEVRGEDAMCAEMASVVAERDPLYRAAAHRVVDANRETFQVLSDLLHGYGAFLEAWAGRTGGGRA